MFEKMLAELRKTLGGSGKSLPAATAGFQDQTIAGGQRVLGTEPPTAYGESPVPPAPEEQPLDTEGFAGLAMQNAAQREQDAQDAPAEAFPSLPVPSKRNVLNMHELSGQPGLSPQSVGPMPLEKTPQYNVLNMHDMDRQLKTLGTNTIDLQSQYDAQPTLPAPAQMIPLPVPEPQGFAPQEAGVQRSGSSTQKINQPRPDAQKQQDNVSAATETIVGPDGRIKSLQDKQRNLDAERMSSLEKASTAKDMSTEEMIAMALITLLPSIVGGIAGNAVAGKAGAAAGVAGGLGGASQGMQGVLAEKQRNKDDAMAQAGQAAARGDKVDNEIAQREGQLEQLGEAGKTRTQNKELAAMREKGDTARNAATNATHMKTANLSAYVDLKKMKAEQERVQGAKQTAGQQTASSDLYTNLDSAFTNMNELENVVRDNGNWESAVGNPQARAALGRVALDTAIAYAKIVDPSSVAREGEVAAAQKYLVPMGIFESNATTLAAIQGMRKSLMQKAAARQHTGMLGELPASSPQGGGGASAAPKSLTQKWGAGK